MDNLKPDTNSMSIQKQKKSRRPPTKKVSRACIHCRNAHITCDDNRPCFRCVKKGTADTCVDAPRKLKKYLEGVEVEKLIDEPKLKSRSMLLSRSLPAVYNDNSNVETKFNNFTPNSQPNTQINTLPSIILPSLPNSVSIPHSSLPLPPTLKPQQPHGQFNNTQRDPSTTPTMANGFIGKLQVPNKDEIDFLSSAADSEYAILGNIIDQSMFNTILQPPNSNYPNPINSSVSLSNYRQESPALSHTNSDDIDIMNYQPLMAPDDSSPSLISSHETSRNTSPFVKPLQPLQMGIPGIQTELISSTENTERKLQYTDLYPEEPQCDVNTNQYFIGTMSTIDGIKTHTFPEVLKQISKFKRKNPQLFKERNRKSAISFSIGIIDDITPEFENTEPENKKAESYSPKCGLMYHEPSEIYEKVKAPFAYVKPYHDLNMYLKSRFSKDNLVQVSKSIAEYRPSFIAGMIKLKEDDLIFAEQCFQRTLLEYDSYIGISGTPTMVWRRTSQIAYVGDEFCILTGWSKEDLVGKSTFAVEIMDDKSCVEYFKIFSKIAFGDLSGETMTECTLLTPRGESIRTSSTWTLKRDVFGIPMMIIATFLPILT
ncbi:hypothetical protein CANINC_002253 [Pichia inconspicua]|uniref:Transcription activator of gluconeogenesis ERT1 n=1 Tax=Pichia inconspicua TaxID=52247 RepID=A0A4T0X212_9ASCO|nr:hypothetical protein CANINC_002253 [[Candida] inconspicua]